MLPPWSNTSLGTCILSLTLNQTDITIIPKKTDPISVFDFFAINLYNFL